MAHVIETLRVVCGILVIISGLMMLGLFGWETPIAGPEARSFQVAMHEAGYFMPIMTVVFLLAGASFIANRYSALSALVLLPISANIMLFHTLLEAGQLPVAIVFFGVNSFMLWYHRTAYAPLLRAKYTASE